MDFEKHSNDPPQTCPGCGHQLDPDDPFGPTDGRCTYCGTALPPPAPSTGPTPRTRESARGCQRHTGAGGSTFRHAPGPRDRAAGGQCHTAEAASRPRAAARVTADVGPAAPGRRGSGNARRPAVQPDDRGDRQDLCRPGRAGAGHSGGPVLQWSRADRKRAGVGQDVVRAHPGPRAGLPVRPDSVHCRPDAVGHHRGSDLRHEDSGVSLPPRDPSSRRFCWPTRSTGRRPKRTPPCWKSCRNTGSRWTARAIQIERPFLVLATQNPIESEGTYNLPEAQLDRFMFKLLVDYPQSERRKPTS